MKNQNIILDFENIINTYQNKIPPKQTNFLKSKRWLPIIQNTKEANEWAYLVGKIMGDGHLCQKYVSSFIGTKQNCLDLQKLLIQKFLLEPTQFLLQYRKAKGESYKLTIHNCLFGRILSGLGAPKGNKTKQPFLVPEWIMSSKECSKLFLQALLEDELSTIKIEKSNYTNSPRLKMAKTGEHLSNLQTFLKQVKEMIEGFGIKCSQIIYFPTPNHQNTEELYFNIKRNKENILRFIDKIGFRIHKNKSIQLQNCKEILTKTRYNRKPMIDKEKVLKLRKKGLTIRAISEKVNINRSTIHRIIRK